jgi:triosephosphate isomerase (TIM)
MRQITISGNWKMHKTKEEAGALISELKEKITVKKTESVIFPPALHIGQCEQLLSNTSISYGAQNIYNEEQGAYTGELSAQMLTSYNCTHVLIGHSERRTLFNESNALLNKKCHIAFQHNLIPTFCIGESLEERQSNQTFAVLDKQLIEGLKGITEETLTNHRLIIAYEPVWAIGTGVVASPEQAQEAHQHIRAKLASIFSEKTAQTITIQYGGSVKAENIETLINLPDIDGALVGGACLKAESFSAIIQSSEQYQDEVISR